MGIQSRLNYCDNIDVQLPPRLNTNSFQLRQGLNADQVWAKNIKLCPLNILDEVSFCLGSNIADLVVAIILGIFQRSHFITHRNTFNCTFC